MTKFYLLLLFSLFLLTKPKAQCVPGSPPLPSVIVDSVSVLPNGDVIICWQASMVVDVLDYDIIMFDPITSANITIDTVSAASGNLCYVIPFGDPNNSSDSIPKEYGVRVRDLCANASINGDNYHNTMFLESTNNICDESINLFWNSYNDFNSGLNVSYEVIVSQNGNPFTLAATTVDTTYIFSNVVQGSNYQFIVRAVENNGAGPFSSSTNTINVSADFFPKDPTFLYLYSASVIDNFKIEIRFYVDTTADAKNYVIKRLDKISNTFKSIGTISASLGMNPLVTFIDSNVEAKLNSYTYIVEIVNTCDKVKFTSNIGKTSKLFVIPDVINLTNTIVWTPYEGWIGNVIQYEIYRSYAGLWEPAPISVTLALVDTMKYIDDLSNALKGNGEFCYKVIAIEGPSINRVGNLTEATSNSNDDCVLHEPIIYIPNAFAPESTFNPVFKPVLTFAELLSYKMIIYDRAGQEIFKTFLPEIGWNGAKDNSGSLLPTDTYVYFIQFQSAGNQQYQYRGRVTLVQ